MALVSRLSTTLLPARFAQTARAWLSQPITGRWLAAVAAILGNLIFQCLDSVNQFAEGLLKQSNDRLFALLVGRVSLFVGRQWYLAHTGIAVGLCDSASRLTLAKAEQLSFLNLPATGRMVSYPAIATYRIENVRTAEDWHVFPALGLRHQLIPEIGNLLAETWG